MHTEWRISMQMLCWHFSHFVTRSRDQSYSVILEDQCIITQEGELHCTYCSITQCIDSWWIFDSFLFKSAVNSHQRL